MAKNKFNRQLFAMSSITTNHATRFVGYEEQMHLNVVLVANVVMMNKSLANWTQIIANHLLSIIRVRVCIACLLTSLHSRLKRNKIGV